MIRNRTVAVITGAAGSIGQALCAAFSAAGHHVVATDLQPPPSTMAPDAFVELDLDAYCRDCDYRAVADDRLAAAIGDDGLAVLVNNAAVQIVKPVEALTADDWARTLNVNLLAPFLLTQSLLKRLELGQGSVVNISSIHAMQTKPGFAAYATSKAALNGLTRSLAVDLGGRVRINAICPGAIATPMLAEGFAGKEAAMQELAAMHPAGRIGEPGEVASLALFLASGTSRFVTGVALALDGGIGARLHDPA